MWRLTAPVACLVLLATVGCGGSNDDSANAAAKKDPTAATKKDPTPAAKKTPKSGGGGGVDLDKVPPCPLTASQVTVLVGQPMQDDGNCLFGDGKGVASLTITMSSASTGAATFDFTREEAVARYGEVKDGDMGEMAYLASDDIEAEAVVVGEKGTYTVILSSFERFGSQPGSYEQILRRILAAVLAA